MAVGAPTNAGARHAGAHSTGARQVAVFAGLILFVVASFLLSLRVGSLRLSLAQLLEALVNHGPAVNRQIVMNIRLPRNIAAALVGICLSISGAILQGVMRNPLAAPNLIGVTAGGGLAAMIVMIVLPQLFALLIPAAFLGALSATLAIYLLAWRRGVTPLRLILAGIAVSSLLGACINALLIFFPERVSGVVDFMVGSLTARGWKHVRMLWPYTLAGVAVAFCMAQRLNILSLGDETATGLGLNVERTRFLLIAISSILAAAACSVAGLLGFVGLIVPHIMRTIIGSDHRVLLPACALFSAGLLMTCDTVGRMIMDPIEMPVGIIMAALGAPFFLYLIRGRMHGDARGA